MMALNSKHPEYAANEENWELMSDCYAGEAAVKRRTTRYLPATAGMQLDGMEAEKPGRLAYDAYLKRAMFPDLVSDAVEKYIGLLHSKPATFELPAAMEPLLERATAEGESLLTLLRRINEHQLVRGRLGLLLDLPAQPDPARPLPYIALYAGDAPRNWDDSDDGYGLNKLNLVVLDETSPVRLQDMEWTLRERYRVLELLPNAVSNEEQGSGRRADDVTERGGGTYMQGVFEVGADGGAQYSLVGMTAPVLRGQTLEEIPFVFVNSKDCLPTPDTPPLLGLARLCMTIYRADADYRQGLYMQGQDTLVVIGGTQADADGTPLRVGAGARITVDIGGDAKYIGVSSEGLSEQRQSLENDKRIAETRAGVLMNADSGQQASGYALHTRLTAQTASLTQIAQTGAAALEKVLRIAAQWMGQDPAAVKVTPNLEFAPQLITGQEVTQLMAARTMGAPLSLRSIHGVFVDRGLTKMTYEEELAAMEEEDVTAPAPGPAPAPQPGGGPGGEGEDA